MTPFTTTTTTTTTTSTNKLSLEEREGFITREFSSRNGNKFQVGFPKSAGYTEGNLDAVVELVKSNGPVADSTVGVNWVYPSSHYPTSQAVQGIGIDRAEVGTGVAPYSYKIDFWNTKGWGFYFKDASGDIYHCSTIRNGHHFVQYNSDKPTIVEVTN